VRAPRIAVLLAVIGAACSEPRESGGLRAPCTTWRDDVGPLVADRCTPCHAGAAPAGGYDVTTYAGALGGGSDEVSNARPGDASSELLARVDPARADPTHRSVADTHGRLSAWVVECDVAYFDSRVHAASIHDPRSTGFHGRAVAETGWDLAACTACHGEDLGGGAAGASCTTCHADGEAGCASCHDERLLSSGAHGTHLGGAVDFDRCDTCHETPASWRAPGHLGDAPAEVRVPYDATSGTCTAASCHGSALADGGGTLTAPSWQDTSGAPTRCGSCHGLPPPGPPGVHARDDCATCHGRVIDDAGAFVDASLHGNGAVEVGSGAAGCGGCHGGDETGVPGPDLEGRTSTREVTVGAHASHVRAPSGLSSPIACGECHTVPEVVGDTGHVDTPSPAEALDPAGPLARAGGASPRWDRATGACTNVYCHGGGAGRFASDTAADLVRAPVWTDVGASVAACGRCHGVPPLDGAHDPALGFRDCTTCHPSVGDYGRILFVDGVTRHLDGVVDVR
jgi:predicted CxxxxCH...CXXCH cytochrome family protein